MSAPTLVDLGAQRRWVPTGIRDTALRVARHDLGALLAVWVLGLVYELHFLFRGWVPFDDGSLAQSAQRVLAGELPHRDFSEMYSGGLSYLHALSFLVFGGELTSMRIVLFAFFAAWIPVLYAVARRFSPPVTAAACVLACVAWSIPNYSASMPSWYNLFFATFAVACLFKYFDGRRLRWLAAAGLACGSSVAVKPTGIYTVVAVVLALLFDEQVRIRSTFREERQSYLAFVVACAVATVGFLITLLYRRFGAAEAASFFVPGTCIAAFLVWNEARMPRPPFLIRFRSLLGPYGTFGAGVGFPIVLLLSPYVVSGSLSSFVHGVLVEPLSRLEFAAQKPLSLVDLPVALVTLVVFFLLGYGLSRASRGVRLVIAGLLLIWFMSSGTTLMYGITLRSIREASLLLVPLGLLLLRSLIRMNVVPPVEHIRTFALLAIFAFAALIQFPYAGLIYFLYVAPLMFLAAVALLGQWRDGGRPVLSPLAVAALFLFVAVFGVARLNQLSSGAAATIGEGAALPVERSGGLIVSPHDSELYRRLVMVIQARAVGRYIYAGPDAPEVYFLADRRNPTRWQFEFLERGSAQDRQLLQALRSHEVSLVVLNHRPSFSPPWDSDVRTALARRYPFHEQIGRFEVRWRA